MTVSSVCANTSCFSRSRYTAKERDGTPMTESGNDYFQARYYSSAVGRFLSPDDGSDQNTSDPQSLNLYGYVRNNPLTNIDPDGHGCQKTTISHMENGKYVVDSIDYDYSSCLSSLTQFLLDAGHRAVNTTVAAAAGHHFIPKQTWQDIRKTTDAYKFLNKVTTRALKNPKLSNSYDHLHRGLNKDTEKLVRDLERERNKSLEDFKGGDFRELRLRIEQAGGDIEKFNARMEALESQARSFGEAFSQALEEVFPAAANAAGEAAPLAADVAEGAVEIP